MIESRTVPSAPLAGSAMAIKQGIIVRRGCDNRYRSVAVTFGVEPIGARVLWDRREQDRRVRAQVPGADRRRADRRGAEPSSWSTLDFLVAQAAPDRTPHPSVKPVDGDLLVLRETSANGPCSVSTVPGPAHVLSPSYNEAVVYALRLAGRVPVDVWYTEDHMAFTAVRRARVHPTMS